MTGPAAGAAAPAELARPFARPREIALFLDVDGTLLRIAATPDAVTIEPDTVELLARPRATGGALALITGRRSPTSTACSSARAAGRGPARVRAP